MIKPEYSKTDPRVDSIWQPVLKISFKFRKHSGTDAITTVEKFNFKCQLKMLFNKLGNGMQWKLPRALIYLQRS